MRIVPTQQWKFGIIIRTITRVTDKTVYYKVANDSRSKELGMPIKEFELAIKSNNAVLVNRSVNN